MDNQIETALCCSDSISQTSVSISDFSDEILLNILRFIPSHDLMLNVSQVCQKLQTLCLDKSLRAHVHLHKEYTANDDAVKRLLKNFSSDIQTLNLSGCYWLAGSTVDQVSRCKALVSLDLSGCRLTSVRLSHLLTSLRSLRSLALDVGPGFDLHQMSAEGKAALARLQELKQTLLTPSYGVVPCCSALRRLHLYLESSEGWREAGGCAQLMVGQSSVPHYQNLRWFSARLAPGEVNRTLLALYLAVFSMRVPEGLMGLVLSVPGPAPPRPVAMTALMESMASTVGNTVSALQLPRTWLDGAILGRVLAHGCPTYLNVSRCSSPGFNPLHVLLSAGRDLTPLQSLNLRGCGRGPLAESCGKGEEEMDAESLKSLTECCPHLIHLNLSATHYHHALPAGQDGHLCGALGRLTALCSLALPVCALAQSPPAPVNPQDSNTDHSSRSLLLGLKKSSRIGVPTYRTATEVTVGQGEERQDRGLCIQPLLQGCPHLVELELIGAGFSSAMPRNEPAIRKDPAACPWSYNVGDSELAALGGMKFLRKLTLAHLPGVLKGTGLIKLVQGCKDLSLLSLANLGSLKTMNYTHALLEALSYCTQLRDLRLEQPYFNANAAFFEALGQCHQLQRVCFVSRHGTFQPAAVVSFMQSCTDVIMCHMFMGGTLVACKTLQKSLLDSFSITRPALSVVIYPLLHEDLANVIRGMPLCHLDEITLFKSRVAEEPIKQ
ncbi:F-box/LRR-repeat protein 18-like isoform X1 [Carassius carassius]|uniref:F-box/LRR-repeat protein 18-like isoform X1 n=1 Tax=Carassius carassius TaxID=217509 RepID=UPI002868B617|nr:F-box/LRR-repeat protein 18-like isoform X1 [Carassius carassius]